MYVPRMYPFVYASSYEPRQQCSFPDTTSEELNSMANLGSVLGKMRFPSIAFVPTESR